MANCEDTKDITLTVLELGCGDRRGHDTLKILFKHIRSGASDGVMPRKWEGRFSASPKIRGFL